MRIIFVGRDCEGVEPPPARELPSAISISTSSKGSSGRNSRTKFSARCFSSCEVARIIRRPGISSHAARRRSEEHTSELQSHHDLVCRHQLEKKKILKALGVLKLQPRAFSPSSQCICI